MSNAIKTFCKTNSRIVKPLGLALYALAVLACFYGAYLLIDGAVAEAATLVNASTTLVHGAFWVIYAAGFVASIAVIIGKEFKHLTTKRLMIINAASTYYTAVYFFIGAGLWLGLDTEVAVITGKVFAVVSTYFSWKTLAAFTSK